MLTTKANAKGTARYLHFDVDDSWAFWEKRAVEIVVEYFDQGRGSFKLEYDSADRARALSARPYKLGGEEQFAGSGEWRAAKFEVEDALFANRQAGGADLRLAADKRGLMIRRVTVRRK